ncbi:nucleoside deaminase [Deinococcus maricopensis]|uniref:CMP/dCMP deaminase zinc-binding protein n=1 Tax=Deinococcus maricopensis (strain DSM 21211 / LMG 22137 / NRRL B-23946 / LB-34) TaxID=709986 RepID=E8U6Q8_DEIML|nr:nucleoside deaminase [Deinococcus maricopensis]ADV66747.1 CMP/dCMP deaminase zinc-binding protein [Deinococcus maricopensis DSM 21211]
MDHRPYLQETLRLAREAQTQGSAPVGAVLVNEHGDIIARGRNRVGEAQTPQHVGDASVAHAEMDLYFQIGKLKDPQHLTLYTSLEPCLMCGGASALLGVRRIVWATDDPWGGSGRLIKWADHPAMQDTDVIPTPDADLEHEGAQLFAPEAKRAFPDEGWQLWRQRYPQETEGVDEADARRPPEH